MPQECRERFPRHRLQRKTLVSDPGMHHGTYVTHVLWYMSGSLTHSGKENVPGIPGACATCNFTYLARGPETSVLGEPAVCAPTFWWLYGAALIYGYQAWLHLVIMFVTDLTWCEFPSFNCACMYFRCPNVFVWVSLDWCHKFWYWKRFALGYLYGNLLNWLCKRVQNR